MTSPIVDTISPEPNHYRRVLDTSISDTLNQTLRIVATDPSLALHGMRILRWQKKAASIRTLQEKEGLLVPPAIFVSVTSRCNLTCHGCYMKGNHTGTMQELNPVQLSTIVSDAAGLGVSIIVLAGGEPLIRKPEIIALARSHPRVLFPVFSNGLMIDDATAQEFAVQKNIIPMISFEGFQNETDARRGTGTYDRLLDVCFRLRQKDVFFGCSVTVTRTNVDLVTSGNFIREMIGIGARAFVFVEYVPVEPGTEDLVLDPAQQKQLHEGIAEFNKNFPALFIGFPGDEEIFGGCLSAGRGFLHVSPSGDLEACPAAPFSDTNLARVPLREALRSPLLAEIRLRPELLTETQGGCALWKNRVWVQSLATRGKIT